MCFIGFIERVLLEAEADREVIVRFCSSRPLVDLSAFTGDDENRLVAIKRIRVPTKLPWLQRWTCSATEVNLLAMECETMKLLDHENVMAPLDHYYEAGSYRSRTLFNYQMVLDLMPDGNASQLVRESNRLPERVVFDVFKQLMHALAHCHERGVVHCDIKPANILIRWEEPGGALTAKLSDFGIARSAMTGYSMRGGSDTAPYMFWPPEFYDAATTQARPAADVWAAFVTAAWLLDEGRCRTRAFAPTQAQWLREVQLIRRGSLRLCTFASCADPDPQCRPAARYVQEKIALGVRFHGLDGLIRPPSPNLRTIRGPCFE